MMDQIKTKLEELKQQQVEENNKVDKEVEYLKSLGLFQHVAFSRDEKNRYSYFIEYQSDNNTGVSIQDLQFHLTNCDENKEQFISREEFLEAYQEYLDSKIVKPEEEKGIVIEFEKVPDPRDETKKGYKITRLKALKYDELPQAYVRNNSAPWVYYNAPGRFFQANCEYVLTVGKTYSEDEIKTKITFLENCGENLRNVKHHVKTLKSKWKGEGKIVI